MVINHPAPSFREISARPACSLIRKKSLELIYSSGQKSFVMRRSVRLFQNRWGAVFLLGFCISLLICPCAHAHARLVRSIPARNGEVTRSPGQIELWFNELLEDGFNTVEVFTAADLFSDKHSNLSHGKVMVDPEDHTHLVAKVEPLKPGDYVIQWRVLSRDGHSAPGRITFHVIGPK